MFLSISIIFNNILLYCMIQMSNKYFWVWVWAWMCIGAIENETLVGNTLVIGPQKASGSHEWWH